MTTPIINLPPVEKVDGAAATKLFFDSYGERPLEFSANEVNAAIGFFLQKGFEEDAAKVTASTLLRQAKIDGVKVFELLDEFKDLGGLELTAIVAQILNKYRSNSSSLGFRSVTVTKTNQTRNIRA
jgi:hypothetical protein